MKILSVIVPCYNSAAYMRRCIESLLPGGDDLEILVIDDGSTDDTLAIARDYERAYPGMVRAIHQENTGHGGAINTGLRHATGAYFKVVDSDDWLDSLALEKVLARLRGFALKGGAVDLLITNFIYDKAGAKRKKVMQYRRALPGEAVLTWADVRRLPIGHYILMHSVIYRTGLLNACGLRLPAHTFYVDNLFVYERAQDAVNDLLAGRLELVIMDAQAALAFAGQGEVKVVGIGGAQQLYAIALPREAAAPVSSTHPRAHETVLDLVCRLLLEQKKQPATNLVLPYIPQLHHIILLPISTLYTHMPTFSQQPHPTS